MQIPRGTTCPILDKKCIQFDCVWWVKLEGTHPQTGVRVDEYDCAVFWQPLLQIENSNKLRETAAEVNKLRNELVTLGNRAATERAAVKEVTNANSDPTGEGKRLPILREGDSAVACEVGPGDSGHATGPDEQLEG